MRKDKDFYIEWFSGTGKGGMKRNKTQSSCRVYHLPTGLMESRQGRSRINNENDAKQALLLKLDSMSKGEQHQIQSATRKNQTGCGMRGDKVRTIRFQNDLITDHRSGKTMQAKKFMRGYMDLLW